MANVSFYLDKRANRTNVELKFGIDVGGTVVFLGC